VPRPLASISVRCALAAALTLALGVAGCGRKGSLDPPPGGLAEPTVIGAQPAPPPAPDGAVAAATSPGAPPPPAPAKKQTPLDWLLN
jgi:predicted small lipoprotein YifL